MSSDEIWIVISTVIFLCLVFKPIKRALTGGLDARRDGIVRELDEAHKLRQEAEALLAQAKARHDSAATDAAEIVAFAREEADRLRAAADAELKEHVARREKQTLDRIGQAEATALSEIRAIAVDLALAASRDLLGGKLAANEGGTLIDQTIAAIPAAIAGGKR